MPYQDVQRDHIQTSRRDIVEFAVGMCHQFISLLCGGIETDGIVNLVISGIWHLLIGSINTGTAGIDEMLYFMVATGLKDVIEAGKVALDIGIGIGYAIAHTCLGSKIDNNCNLILCEDFLYCFFVGDGSMNKVPGNARR